jgi:serine/threonine protein kinase
MAPERFRTGTPGPASDLWSLGATLYMAVEGHPPFQADELEVLIGRLLMGDDPAFVRSGALEPVLRGLLNRDPGKRWDSRRVTEGLKAVADGRTLTMPLAGRVVPRKPGNGLLVVAGVLVLLVLAGVSVPFLASSASDSKDRFESIPDACAVVRNGPILKELMSDPEVSETLEWGPFQDHGSADSCSWSNIVSRDATSKTSDATFAVRADLPRRSTVADLPHWTKVPGLGDAAVRQSRRGDGESTSHGEMIIFTLRNAEIGLYLTESSEKRTDTERQTRVLQIAKIIESALRESL